MGCYEILDNATLRTSGTLMARVLRVDDQLDKNTPLFA